MRASAFLVVLLGLGACRVFEAGLPCRDDGECPRGLCAGDGFCADAIDTGPPPGPRDGGGPLDDAGPSPRDAGSPDEDDAGRPRDAGPREDEDAGPDGGPPNDDAGPAPFDAGPRPRAIVDVTAVDALPAGYAVSFAVDEGALGDSGPLSVFRVDGGTQVPFAPDPWDDDGAPPRWFWAKLADPLPAGAHAALGVEVRPGSAGPRPLDQVLLAGDDFEGVPSASLVAETSGAATAVLAGGRMVLDMGAVADAAVVRTASSWTRATPFALHHRVRVPFIGNSGFVSGGDEAPGLMRVLTLVEGFVPDVVQNGQALFEHEVLVVEMGQEGGYLWVATSGDVGDATDTAYWDGDSWTFTPSDARFVGNHRTGDLDVYVWSDGVSLWISVEENGTLLADTTPFPWSSIDQRESAGAPLYVFWGEPYAGPGEPYDYADVDSEFFTMRPWVDGEPTVVVIGP